MKKTEFENGFLKGTSHRTRSVNTLVENDAYDVVVFSSSWDARCITIPAANAELSCKHAIVILPTRKDSKGLRTMHDKRLTDFAKSVSANYVPIEGDTHDPSILWQNLKDALLTISVSEERPINILLDVSTCARYFSLASMSMLLALGLARRISIFYSEAKYTETSGQHEIAFTSGSWETHQVPFLEGDYFPEKRRAYFVSVGFEGLKTFRVIAHAEPDKVSILFPRPGFRKRYEEVATEQTGPIIEGFSIGRSSIIDASAGDAVAAWKALTNAKLEDPIAYNTYFLCCGTKAHSVALAVRALVLGYPCVLYFVPEVHRVVETEPSGYFWRYDFEDLSQPSP